MFHHRVRVHRSSEPLDRVDELAHRLAVVALDDAPVDTDVAEMVGNRVIDNAAVAIASLDRAPVAAARDQALAHPYERGATLYGVGGGVRVAPEWAAWANAVAVRELDFHDTFLAADYSHPGDNIAPIVAVAQHAGLSGADVLRGIVAAYEIHIGLVRSMCLHAHRIDHIAHLAPASAAGIGAALRLPADVVYHAIGQALHTSTATRQSRKGHISTWKAYAPGFAAKVAVEAIDRAMRGQTSPAPIYEGEDGFLAWLLDGPDARYSIALPEPGEPRRAIMDSYTKEHSAEYQAQAFIDLAARMRERVPDTDRVSSIVLHTSHHTHTVIGSGAGDPQKYDPTASRETLDHSIAYIFAVALQDGRWHHVDSYAPERACRPDTVRLWRTITTVESPMWTKRYRAPDPVDRAFGGRAVVTLDDGTVIVDELAVADAHPAGARPFARAQYIAKFDALTDGVITVEHRDAFLMAVDRLPELTADELTALTVDAPLSVGATTKGLF